MIVESTRFGTLEVPTDKIVRMEKPILGFESLRRFCLVEVEELNPFMWMQSTDNPSVAFLVVNPLVFYPDYRVKINSNEIAELKVNNAGSVETYVIVTVPEEPSKMSLNLQGPILINTENNLAKQLVLVDSEYRVKHFVMSVLDQMQPEVVREEELVGG